MAHEEVTFDDSFHQTDFIESIQYIPTGLSTVPLTADVQTYSNTFGTPLSQVSPILVNDYTDVYNTYQAIFEDQLNLSSFSFDDFSRMILSDFEIYIANKSYTSWSTFENGWYDFEIARLSDILLVPESVLSPLVDRINLYHGLLLDLTNSLGIQIDANNNMVSGDWMILTQLPDPLIIDFTNTSSPSNPFVQAFDHFMAQYNFNASTLMVTYPDFRAFIDQYHAFLQTSAHMQVPAQSYEHPDYTGFFSDISSYEQIFFAFSPPTVSHSDFVALMKQFYQDKINQDGYFMPGHLYPEWVDAVRLLNKATLPQMGVSSLSGNSSIKILIIDRILRLIIKIITTLQDVGIEQANRLSFTTQYQQVYTGLQNQIPVFLRGDDGVIGASSTSASQIRNDLNSSFNGVLTDNLRALRGLEEDRAKTQQSDVSTTNDAVNQQTDMASSFIQQMSSILSSIFK